ncbi:MAG: AMP-binding protein, partial [bacterium]|nr:AMP-binding protein [bacterium]
MDLPRPPAVTFRDYVALERRSLESETSRRYWLDKLARISPILLPRVARRKRPRVGAVGVYQATISDHLSERLKALARELGMPVKSVLLAAHLRVLSVLGNQADVVTGLVANGRPEAADGERTLGLFLNTLPLRVRVPGGSWTSLVEAAYQADLEALPHRRYPLAEIQRELGGQPLFETAFNYTHFHIYRGLAATEGVASLGGKSFERTNFALLVNFSLGILSGQVELSLHYDAGELERAQVVLFGRYYAAALAAMTRAPAERYELRTLLSPAERHQLVVEWNVTGRPAGDPPRRRCLHDLFAEQAERTPAAIAVVSGGRVLSYRELDRRADRLARRLGSLGVGPEAAVGISLERSLELMVAVLAVLKAGGVCVPLDRAYPRPHREFILRDSRAAVLLADERPESVPSGVRVVCPDDARENPSSHAGRPA